MVSHNVFAVVVHREHLFEIIDEPFRSASRIGKYQRCLVFLYQVIEQAVHSKADILLIGNRNVAYRTYDFHIKFLEVIDVYNFTVPFNAVFVSDQKSGDLIEGTDGS